MTEMEKVIRGLEVCTANGTSCDGCPYFEPVEIIRCDCPMMKDVLALLREQEPVVPSKTLDGYGNLWRDCGKCGGVLPKHAQYCPTCGRKVKWDD